jgi:hypothetical protein
MKHLLILVLLASLLSGCKEKEIVEIETNDITGRWLWMGTGGGFGGGGYTPSKGEKIVLELDFKGNFNLAQNDSLVQKGKYSIEKSRTIYGEKSVISYEEIIRGNTQNASVGLIVLGPVIVSLTNKKLSTSDNMYDGFGSSFTKIR